MGVDGELDLVTFGAEPASETETAHRDAVVGPNWPDRGTRLLVVAVIALSALFLVSNASLLNSRFSTSFDGLNGSVWGGGSRAMREDGIVASRFGGLAPRGAYANHPPGLLAESYVAESVAGEHHIVTRAPAWIASIIALALMAWLLVEAGFRRGVVAAAIAIVATSSMFLVYGTMLDTPITSLPYSLGVLIAAQRVVKGRPPRPWLLVLLGFLAVCSGWQSATFLACVGVWIVLAKHSGRDRFASATWLAAGGALGLAVTLAWIRWVYGSFGPLTNRQAQRASGMDSFQALKQQGLYLVDLIPYAGAVGLVGLLLVLIGAQRVRPLVLAASGSVLSYAVYFRQGAAVHDFWNYAILIPLAVTIAVVAEMAYPLIARLRTVRPQLLAIVVVGSVMALSLTHSSDPGATRAGAVTTSRLIDSALDAAPPGGPVLALVPPMEDAKAQWVLYETRRPALDLRLNQRDIMVQPGSEQVPTLFWLASADADMHDHLLRVAIDRQGPWVLLRAGDLPPLDEAPD